MAKTIKEEDLRLNIIVNGDAGRKQILDLEAQPLRFTSIQSGIIYTFWGNANKPKMFFKKKQNVITSSLNTLANSPFGLRNGRFLNRILFLGHSVQNMAFS